MFHAFFILSQSPYNVHYLQLIAAFFTQNTAENSSVVKRYKGTRKEEEK